MKTNMVVDKENQGFVGNMVWRYFINRYEDEPGLYASLTLSDMDRSVIIHKENLDGIIEVLMKFKTELENV